MAGYCLKNIPSDVFKFIIEEQSRLKQERGTNKYSFESTIYKMLKDYKRCKEENKNFKPQ